MKKLIICVLGFILSNVALSHAGMINYERRERFQREKEAKELTTVRASILRIDEQRNRLLLRVEKGGEERELKIADMNLLSSFMRGQKVNATYNMNSKELKKIALIEE